MVVCIDFHCIFHFISRPQTTPDDIINVDFRMVQIEFRKPFAQLRTLIFQRMVATAHCAWRKKWNQACDRCNDRFAPDSNIKIASWPNIKSAHLERATSWKVARIAKTVRLQGPNTESSKWTPGHIQGQKQIKISATLPKYVAYNARAARPANFVHQDGTEP